MVGLTLDGASLHLCGEPRRLRFDWDDFAALRSKYGIDFQEKINVGIAELDFEIIADTISLAVKGALTPAQIRKSPPPIVASIKALNQAFNEAYHGPDGPSKIKRPFVQAMTRLRSILSWIRSKRG